MDTCDCFGPDVQVDCGDMAGSATKFPAVVGVSVTELVPAPLGFEKLNIRRPCSMVDCGLSRSRLLVTQMKERGRRRGERKEVKKKFLFCCHMKVKVHIILVARKFAGIVEKEEYKGRQKNREFKKKK